MYALEREVTNASSVAVESVGRNVLLDDREEILLSGDGQGDYALREVIADYLHQARGVNCEASQIVIGAGNEYLELLLAQVLGKEKRVLMDDPTYVQAYRTFCNMGYEVHTVPHSHGSMPIETVRQENPDILYVMPSHQFPLGTVMPLKQRLELLKWASEQAGRYLIEDDHDSEYRYKGKFGRALPDFLRLLCRDGLKDPAGGTAGIYKGRLFWKTSE